MVEANTPVGLLFVLVGPTAVGKTTLIKKVLGQVPDLAQIPTATTRPIRANEQEGREHYFFDKAGFQHLIDSGALLENQEVHGFQYGIIRARLEEALAAGYDQIADIEVLGAAILREAFPHNAVLIFISPPTAATLEKRIRERGDKPDEIERRLGRVPFEMQFAPMCNTLIVNDDLEIAASELMAVIAAERRRRALRHFVRVAARIQGEDALAELPSTHVRAKETSVEAVRRLLSEKGDDPSAARIDLESFHLTDMQTAPNLLLVYDCEIPGTADPDSK
jgi:guanylate kinase